MRTRVLVSSAAAVAALGAAALTGSAAFGSSAPHRQADLLRSSVAGSLVGEVVAGVPAGGLPWTIDRGTIRLTQSGRLQVDVRGLVVPGVGNPVPRLSASVACNDVVLPDRAPSVKFTKAGDARIRSHITVPARCLAPVVLLNPNDNAGAFIGVSGRQR